MNLYVQRLQASDETLLEKLHKNHEKHKYYEKPKRRIPQFVVRHYAGDVSYTIKAFLDKNRCFYRHINN